MKKRIAIYSLLLFAVFSSCEINPTIDSENREFIFNSWVVESVQIDGFEDFVTDYSNFELQFVQENQVIYTDIYGQSVEGTFQIEDPDALRLQFSQEQRLYYIIELNEDRLILVYQDDYIKETTANFQYTLIPLN